jgi:hypothetical protein
MHLLSTFQSILASSATPDPPGDGPSNYRLPCGGTVAP